MIGVYGGYDSRPMNTGEHEDSSINVSNSQSAFFEQIALGIEAESYRRKYEINGNFPIGNRYFQCQSKACRFRMRADNLSPDPYSIEESY